MICTGVSIGDFIITTKSLSPAVVISNNLDNMENKLLVSISEYNGDYIFIDVSDANIIRIDNYSKLSILAGFGEWFYEQHKELYQEHIVNTLLYR